MARPPVPTLQEKVEQSTTIANNLSTGMQRRCEGCRWYRKKSQYQNVCYQPFVDQTHVSNYGKIIHRDIDVIQARNSDYLCGSSGELFEKASMRELATGIHAEKTLMSAIFAIVLSVGLGIEFAAGAPWWAYALSLAMGGMMIAGPWFDD